MIWHKGSRPLYDFGAKGSAKLYSGLDLLCLTVECITSGLQLSVFLIRCHPLLIHPWAGLGIACLVLSSAAPSAT